MRALCMVLLLSALGSTAHGQASLSVRPGLGGGYDSNIYYGAGALPDDVDTYGGAYLGLTPEAELSLTLGQSHRLLLFYNADLRQMVTSDQDYETLISHGLTLAYAPPSLAGFQPLVGLGLSGLYLARLPGGGWLGGQGMLQVGRALGRTWWVGLTYALDFTDYNAASSSSWELANRVLVQATWQPLPGLRLSPAYTLSLVRAKPRKLSSISHQLGLTARWQLPWLPLQLEAGYMLMTYQLDSASYGQGPFGPPPGFGPGQGPPPQPPQPPPGVERRLDLLHQADVQANVQLLPWLAVEARWSSMWGTSNLTDDYSRHQALGGLRFTWSTQQQRRPALALPPAAHQPDRTLELELSDAAAKQVAVVGTFNHWDAGRHRLVRQGNTWRRSVPLPPGLHQYMLWVDGQIRPPPGCQRWVPDGFGSRNCVILIGEP